MSSVEFRDKLVQEFSPYGVLEEGQLDALERHFDLLTFWNKTLNLTRITALEDIVRLHYAESLFLAKWLPAGKLCVADIGSGGGFPGVPVAIFRPECTITLVESHQRKSVFLRQSVRGLRNVVIQAVRAEVLEGQFDWIVARAVDPREVARLTQAPRKALLVGEADGRSLGFGWEIEKVPWGEGRVVAFHVEQSESAK